MPGQLLVRILPWLIAALGAGLVCIAVGAIMGAIDAHRGARADAVRAELDFWRTVAADPRTSRRRQRGA
ncbi:MAG TPA: hypothetical protein VN607_05395 [Gemmatimonadaceae bacterium]|nr:hypothetical protein [Gemmatimonadaceae bacterium]